MPSECSAVVKPGPPRLTVEDPTAVQSLVPEHETAPNPPWAPGLGVGSTIQSTPFHLTAKYPPVNVARSAPIPTAVQALIRVQLTPFNTVNGWAPVALGVGSIAQVWPRLASAKLTVRPLAPVVLPTAVHARRFGQETALKPLELAPAGFAVDWIDQRRPFQRSAIVTDVTEVGWE
jgi:hypothetical protein